MRYISLTIYILSTTSYITRNIYIPLILYPSFSILTLLLYYYFLSLLIIYLFLYSLSISYRRSRLWYKGLYRYRARLSRLYRISIKLIEYIDFTIIIISIVYISAIKFIFYNYIALERAPWSLLITISSISL